MKNKALIIFLVILAVAAAGYLVLNRGLVTNWSAQNQEPIASQPADKESNQESKVKLGAQGSDREILPKNFPADLPLEAGAEVTLNYNTVNAKGESQASREFISEKTVAENYALYRKALSAKGWRITETKENTPAGNLIFAEMSNNKLNIRIYTDANKKVRVSINNIVNK